MFEAIKNAAWKIGFQVKKHSPEIFIGISIVSGVACVATACKATIKSQEIIETAQDQLNTVEKVLSDETVSPEDYTGDDAQKDKTIIYTQTGVKLLKEYAPSIVFGTISVVSMLNSHRIMSNRNTALAATLSSTIASFESYRNKVIDKFGDMVDKEFLYGLKAEEIEEETTDEQGNKKTEKKTVYTGAPTDCSPFARFFDESSRYWRTDPGYNLMFVRSMERYANDLLRAHGHLFLNEVYDMLGFPRTKSGATVGWVYDPNNPECEGDNYVDFGIYNMTREGNRNFVNGLERTVLLDFNVDGDIYSKFEDFVKD